MPTPPGATVPATQVVPASPLDTLNPEQVAAVLHAAPERTRAGPLLVIAGAGSGKTSTLAHCVAHLLVRGADPERILLLTFSRRAAAELERRAARVVQDTLRQRVPSTLPWAGTFHGVGARLVREYALRIGLDPQFTIHDRTDSEDLLGLVRHELAFEVTAQRFPTKGTCLAIYSRAVNSGTPLADVLAQSYPWCVAFEAELRRLFAAYVAAKQAQHVLDFDDLLLYWSHMAADPALGAEIGARFTHVLVDEYQDTNRLQAAILLGMKPHGEGVVVVGDDAQAIYSFRSATVRNILDFPGCFDPPARVVTLDRNYRSTQPILDASNAVIGLARERFTKNLWTERVAGAKPRLVSVRDEAEQARCVAERVLEHREAGIALKSQAVLFRSSAHSAQLELELARRGIPFVKYGGLQFLEAAHIKDVLSLLRFADNPRGRIAGFRVLQLLPGIGPATATRVLEAVDAAADPHTALQGFSAPANAAAAWPEFVQLVAALRDPRCAWPAGIDLAARWYEPHLERLYEDAGVRARDLAQLVDIASTYPSRERFLTELTLDPPSVTSADAGRPARDEDYLILSTIHSAKGQEWKSVHVLNAVDGCIPSDMATGSSEEIEEERRLLYVAMTRARDHLDLIVPQRFYVRQQAGLGDRHVYAARTRFLPDALLVHFECSAWPRAVPELAAPSARARAEAAHRYRRASSRRLEVSARQRLASRGSKAGTPSGIEKRDHSRCTMRCGAHQ